MRIPQVQITTTDLKMDHHTTKGKLRIEHTTPQLTIEQPPAILNISTTRGTLSIDASQARREIGMISAFESVKNYAAQGKQTALQGITRRVQEGRQLMESAGKGQGVEPIKNIAKQNHGPKRAGPINVKFVPSIGSVKIDYQPGTVQVNNQAQPVKIDAHVNKPVTEYTPGNVTGTMLQRPDVHIDVIG